MQKILEQHTYIAVNTYKGQIINYNFVDVCISYVYAICLMFSDKTLVQCKVYSHVLELGCDVHGSIILDGTAVAIVQRYKLF